jgi:hypothetical protein
VGLLVKGIEYMEKLREKLKAIDVKPIDNSSDNKNATTQGDDSQEDKKPVKKPEKKSSLFSKLGSMLKDFFTEDEEPSKL